MIYLECARPPQGCCSFGLYRGQKKARPLIEANINGVDTSYCSEGHPASLDNLISHSFNDFGCGRCKRANSAPAWQGQGR